MYTRLFSIFCFILFGCHRYGGTGVVMHNHHLLNTPVDVAFKSLRKHSVRCGGPAISIHRGRGEGKYKILVGLQVRPLI